MGAVVEVNNMSYSDFEKYMINYKYQKRYREREIDTYQKSSHDNIKVKHALHTKRLNK